jgi:hypothetical protein
MCFVSKINCVVLHSYIEKVQQLREVPEPMCFKLLKTLQRDTLNVIRCGNPRKELFERGCVR